MKEHVKLVKRGCSDPFSGKLFHKLFSDWHMLDTLFHLLYISNDMNELGQNSSAFQNYNDEFEQKRKTYNS